MVKIIIEINEKFQKEYEAISATAVEVETEIKGIGSTKNEREVAELIKSRIGTNSGKNLEKFLESLFSI